MITRIWHGMTRADRADEYLEFLEDEGFLLELEPEVQHFEVYSADGEGGAEKR